MNSTVTRMVRRPLIAVPASLLLVAAVGVGAHAALTDASGDAGAAAASNGQSQDAHAIVVNHGDNRYRYAITVKVVKVTGDVVDPQNAAVAVAANCTDCTTVAISMQGVLVYGDPTVFAPENLALAYNQNCTNCQTLAEAYQQIVPASGKVRITGAGRQEIAAVRHDVEMIRHDSLTLAQIDARVDGDAARLLAVLRNDVVPIGKPADTATTSSPTETAGPTTTGGTTTPSTDGSATTSPGTDSPTPDASTSPSPTPSPSATGVATLGP
ncbi:MAG: putative peptide zinc metalloprotease protein [Frankiaceae bacterium]|nr:putative peptide zinc metalloprotease protein [Frankiaceae bacterium]